MMDTTLPTTMLSTAQEAAKKAGEIILKYFGGDVSFALKADKTVVSIADKEAEQAIKELVLKRFPSHVFVGEETGTTGIGKIRWHVDPLDGTTNFKNKIPICGISIGVEMGGEAVLGVIYNPFTNQLFWAEKGNGAFCNGTKIKVNSLSLAKGIVVLDGSFRDDRALRKIKTQEELLSCGATIRAIGSNVLQLSGVASGQFVCSISDAVHSYDFMAGAVLVKEAGGVVTDYLGNAVTSDSVVVIASNNQENHRQLLELTKKYYLGYQGM